MAVQDHVDVVTIGAGWTASILAWKLGEAGLKVRSLEQGNERWTASDFQHNHDGLRFSVRKAMHTDLTHETFTWRPNPNKPALPMRRHSTTHPGQGLGGAGIHWEGQTWRFYPSDFNYRTHHIERYGEDRLPEGSTLQDWPLTYEELEPYYTAFEYDIGVSGQAGRLNGQTLPGGNPYEGSRTRPYPLPPLQNSLGAEKFMETAGDMGYHPFPQPISILSEAYTGLSGRPRAACLYCGFCTRYGCEVDAKASPITDHVPVALETGNWDIRYNAKVTEIMLGNDGLATGLRYVDMETGEEHEQPADIVILSGYMLANVRMLLVSTNSEHPDGVGNDQGQVGRNYTYQLIDTPVTGIFEGTRLNTYMGNGGVSALIHDFNADNFDHSDLDFIGGASVEVGGGERQPVLSALTLPHLDDEAFEDYEDAEPDYALGAGLITEFDDLDGQDVEWGPQWKENLRNTWDSVLGMDIQGESLAYEDHYADLDPNYTDAFGLPLLRISWDFRENDYRLHEFMKQRLEEVMEAMEPARIEVGDELEPYVLHDYQSTHNTGGAIMGSSPENSVTNKYGQVWDTPNVFVTGAALYPQNPGMNPTGTVLALAYHTADAMVEQYIDNPEELMT